jgi:hypothetical protein
MGTDGELKSMEEQRDSRHHLVVGRLWCCWAIHNILPEKKNKLLPVIKKNKLLPPSMKKKTPFQIIC